MIFNYRRTLGNITQLKIYIILLKVEDQMHLKICLLV
jgi:hypothetical protein